jgi:hypothetical protein
MGSFGVKRPSFSLIIVDTMTDSGIFRFLTFGIQHVQLHSDRLSIKYASALHYLRV